MPALSLKTVLAMIVLSIQLLTISATPYLTILDTRSERYHVYRRDGSVYGRYDSKEEFSRATEYEILAARDGGTCTALTVKQAKLLPGWSKEVQYDKDHYGTGKYKLVLNPPEFPKGPAEACIDSGVVKFVAKPDDIKCTEQTTETSGVISGTNGTVTAYQVSGYSLEASNTVTRSTTVGDKYTYSVDVKVPEVADFGGSITFSVDVTNTVGSTTSSAVNTQTTQMVAYAAPNGKACSAKVTTKTCRIQGTARVRILATGGAWFDYASPREAKIGPKDGKHFKYFVSFVNGIRNVDDRSSWLEFTGNVQMTTNTKYDVKCAAIQARVKKGAAKPKVPAPPPAKAKAKATAPPPKPAHK